MREMVVLVFCQSIEFFVEYLDVFRDAAAIEQWIELLVVDEGEPIASVVLVRDALSEHYVHLQVSRTALANFGVASASDSTATARAVLVILPFPATESRALETKNGDRSAQTDRMRLLCDVRRLAAKR